MHTIVWEPTELELRREIGSRDKDVWVKCMIVGVRRMNELPEERKREGEALKETKQGNWGECSIVRRRKFNWGARWFYSIKWCTEAKMDEDRAKDVGLTIGWFGMPFRRWVQITRIGSRKTRLSSAAGWKCKKGRWEWKGQEEVFQGRCFI